MCRVRKLLIGLVSAVAAVAIGAVGVDFGAAIYAEYRLARACASDAELTFDPWVAILGFPFISPGEATATTPRSRSRPMA